LQSKKIKILQLIDTLHAGGAERMAVNIANALFEKHIQNILVASYADGPMSANLNSKTPLHILNKKNAFDLMALYRLVKWVIQYRPTHLHAHSTSVIWGAALKCIFPEIKLIWHDHFGLDTKEIPRNYMRYILPLVDSIIAVKQDLVTWVKSLNFENDVHYISNFASVQLTNDRRNHQQILCLANFRRQKDFATLVHAASILRELGLEFHIRIVGNLADEDYVKEIELLISAYKLNTYISITGPTNEVSKELSIAGIGVLSSFTEGLPVSLIEYGLAALPVVVTDAGQCREVLQDGQSGLIVPVGDSRLLASAIENLLTNTESAIEMGKKFNQHIINNYGVESFIQPYLALVCESRYV
jgi:glycosyltransferase involved in cell wall biosynthesis